MGEKKDLISVFNSLGNFISAGGAIAAILTVLQFIYSRKEDRANSEVEKLKYALFLIDSQITFISYVDKKLIDAKNDSALIQAINLLSLIIHAEAHEKLNYKEYSFLLSKQEPTLVKDIFYAQSNLSTFVQLLEERNKIYTNDYQKSISGKFTVGSRITEEDLLSGVDRNILLSIIDHTDELYKGLPKVKSRLEKSRSALSQFVIKKYPDHEFLD